MKVSFILGAGFSLNAGLPLANHIWGKLNQEDLEEQLVHHGSGEWGWRELTSGAQLSNGSYSSSIIPIAMLMKNALAEFKGKIDPERHNYEEFYQWLVDLHYSDEKWQGVEQLTRNHIDEKFGSDNSLSTFPLTPRDLIFCLVHLVDDLLWCRKNSEEYSHSYEPYLQVLRDPDNDISIYTLNHDLVVETLIEAEGLELKDGFSTDNSNLFGPHEPEKVRIFDNSFDGRIKLYKLHGSIDQHRYYYLDITDRVGQIDYFKTLDFHVKQRARYIDESGKVQQFVTPEIDPQFITGRNKIRFMKSDYMYAAIYEAFEKNLPDTDLLIINGYSYQDPHVDEVLKNCKDSIGSIININPGTPFPYEHANVININPLNEAIILE